MSGTHEGFPSRLHLWQGAILATIAHAIALAQGAAFSHELSWDGPNYNRQDSMGTRGTITFLENLVVGVFRDDNSPRAPWRSKKPLNLQEFLWGMPEDLLTIAHGQTLKYVVDEYEGVVGPIITSAFWSKGEYLTAVEPWSEVVTHGAHLIRIEVMETDVAIAEWQSQYELSTHQVDVIHSLFQRRISTPNWHVALRDNELRALTVGGIEGLTASLELLAGIGFIT
jgi:hypothetical protein